jgi:hypothetical protein
VTTSKDRGAAPKVKNCRPFSLGHFQFPSKVYFNCDEEISKLRKLCLRMVRIAYREAATRKITAFDALNSILGQLGICDLDY